MFSTPVLSVINALVMTIGELDYGGTFIRPPTRTEVYSDRVFYQESTLFLFVIFVIFLSLLLSNLLVS